MALHCGRASVRIGDSTRWLHIIFGERHSQFLQADRCSRPLTTGLQHLPTSPLNLARILSSVLLQAGPFPSQQPPLPTPTNITIRRSRQEQHQFGRTATATGSPLPCPCTPDSASKPQKYHQHPLSHPANRDTQVRPKQASGPAQHGFPHAPQRFHPTLTGGQQEHGFLHRLDTPFYQLKQPAQPQAPRGKILSQYARRGHPHVLSRTLRRGLWEKRSLQAEPNLSPGSCRCFAYPLQRNQGHARMLLPHKRTI